MKTLLTIAFVLGLAGMGMGCGSATVAEACENVTTQCKLAQADTDSCVAAGEADEEAGADDGDLLDCTADADSCAATSACADEAAAEEDDGSAEGAAGDGASES